jgi:hypothetical protein
MIPTLFCNYNLDYQQRLGFLTLVAVACDTCRGNREAFVDRLTQLYEGRRSLTNTAGPLDLRSLVVQKDVPSWQLGFSSERLDRLVLWAEMMGIIAHNGRLSEWSRILQQIVADDITSPRFNPFVLSLEQKAFFLHLLFIHDQALPFLVSRLAALPSEERITVRSACLLTVDAIGAFYDTIPPTGPDRIKLRQELRDLLERIAGQYRLHDKRALLTAESRSKAISDLRSLRTVPRVHLAEYHAICRFEQLADLGVVSKTAGARTIDEEADRKKIWEWNRNEHLGAARSILDVATSDLERFLTDNWIEFTGIIARKRLVLLDPIADQVEIAHYLDATLTQSRRPLGPVQVHSWALLAALNALRESRRIEVGVVFRLLDLMRASPTAASIVRQGGRTTFLGRTASVHSDHIADQLSNTPITEGGM